MKGLRVTKNDKEINFLVVWGELEPKKVTHNSQNITHKTFGTNSSFHSKEGPTGKV